MTRAEAKKKARNVKKAGTEKEARKRTAAALAKLRKIAAKHPLQDEWEKEDEESDIEHGRTRTTRQRKT